MTWVFEEDTAVENAFTSIVIKEASDISLKETSYNASTSQSTLTFRNVSVNMSGTYKCLVQNHIGIDVGPVDLNING